MDYSLIISQVAELIKYAFPVSLIFGLTAKFINIALDMILNRKIEM